MSIGLTGSSASDVMMLDAESIPDKQLRAKYVKTLETVINPDCDCKKRTQLWKRILGMPVEQFPLNMLVYQLTMEDLYTSVDAATAIDCGELPYDYCFKEFILDTLKDDKHKAHRELINNSQETIILAYQNAHNDSMEDSEGNPYELFQFCTLTDATIEYLVDEFTQWCWHDDDYGYAHSILQCLEDAKQWEVLERLENHDWKIQYFIYMNIPHFDEMKDWDKGTVEHLLEIIGEYLRDHRIAKDLEKLAKWSRLSIVR